MRTEFKSRRIDLGVIVHIFLTFLFHILNVCTISEFERKLQNFSLENMRFSDYFE